MGRAPGCLGTRLDSVEYTSTSRWSRSDHFRLGCQRLALVCPAERLGHRLIEVVDEFVDLIKRAKSSSVRFWPSCRVTLPVATLNPAIRVWVPWRLYSNSRRSTRHAVIGCVGAIRSSACIPFISSIEIVLIPAASRSGARRYVSQIRSCQESLRNMQMWEKAWEKGPRGKRGRAQIG